MPSRRRCQRWSCHAPSSVSIGLATHRRQSALVSSRFAVVGWSLSRPKGLRVREARFAARAPAPGLKRASVGA